MFALVILDLFFKYEVLANDIPRYRGLNIRCLEIVDVKLGLNEGLETGSPLLPMHNWHLSMLAFEMSPATYV